MQSSMLTTSPSTYGSNRNATIMVRLLKTVSPKTIEKQKIAKLCTPIRCSRQATGRYRSRKAKAQIETPIPYAMRRVAWWDLGSTRGPKGKGVARTHNRRMRIAFPAIWE
jgi:hypothetical protein